MPAKSFECIWFSLRILSLSPRCIVENAGERRRVVVPIDLVSLGANGIEVVVRIGVVLVVGHFAQ